MELVFNRQTQLALLAFDVLSHSETRLSRNEIADRVGTSVDFLPQVIRPLIEAGWVTSQRGPSGGYEMAVDPGAVTLLDVVQAIEGPMDGRCVLTGLSCGGDEPCRIHDLWSEMRNTLLNEMATHPMTTRSTEMQHD
jgi:Rrf2 family transcriptional regulator, iron-sulfur cluster assembly transcription factor